jgi:hypothetical protein
VGELEEWGKAIGNVVDAFVGPGHYHHESNKDPEPDEEEGTNNTSDD